MRSPRRQVAALAVLATALTAVSIPAAGTTAATDVDRAEVRAALTAAIADENRAWVLINKRPPRRGTAALMLDRSERRLNEINGALRGSALASTLPGWVSENISEAANRDNVAAGHLRRFWTATDIFLVEKAVRLKSQALAALDTPAAASSPECSDGKDNDGDRLVDGRVDSGCTAAEDGSESTALTCSLGYTSAGTSVLVQGTCSGPFSKIELTAPTGVSFDTRTMPVVQQAQACRYATERRLECLMSDGVANPQHVVNARFKLTKRSASGLRMLIRDFLGRGRAQPVSAALSLRFKLSYTHEGLSHVCASIEATSGAFLELTLEGPNGQSLSGTLQLKKKDTATAPGGFSFRILEFGIYRVTIKATKNGKSVEKTQTIGVTDAPGDSRCSATGAPPP
jgi:hypothetical protein